VRRFAAEEVAPHSARIDREAEYPREVYRRIGEEGLVGFTRPQGAGGTALEWAMWILHVDGDTSPSKHAFW